MRKIKEKCCKFGQHDNLSGILTEPTASVRKGGVILVNAGLVPKFGPYRFYTELARRLASEGHLVLRFDLSGIGDSLQKDKSIPLKTRTQLEIGAALDFLSKREDIDEIFVAGLCSGAEDSFRYAENDHRVKGVILIDPFCYRTPGFEWRYFFHRLNRRSLRALGLYRPIASNKKKALIDYKYMEFSESSRILKKLIDRNVRIHFVYTGGMRDSFNHKGQLKSMFKNIDFKGLVTIDYFPQMDHTQVFKDDRDLLSASIRERL